MPVNFRTDKQRALTGRGGGSQGRRGEKARGDLYLVEDTNGASERSCGSSTVSRKTETTIKGRRHVWRQQDQKPDCSLGQGGEPEKDNQSNTVMVGPFESIEAECLGELRRTGSTDL